MAKKTEAEDSVVADLPVADPAVPDGTPVETVAPPPPEVIPAENAAPETPKDVDLNDASGAHPSQDEFLGAGIDLTVYGRGPAA